METMSRREKDLTPEAFAKFLAKLAPEPEIAGVRYEELRRQLIKFFEWRGSFIADQLADETLNRVVRWREDRKKHPRHVFGDRALRL
jgi:hypothetical protein